MEIEEEKKLAIALFNSCWELIEKPNRTDSEDAEMVHLAHTSRWHWGNVGGDLERAIGEWQCSRVNSILGNGNAALLHAKLSSQFISDIPSPHFMKASAAEAMAFAYFVLGNLSTALEYKQQASQLLEGVNEADATHIRNQIAELPF